MSLPQNQYDNICRREKPIRPGFELWSFCPAGPRVGTKYLQIPTYPNRVYNIKESVTISEVLFETLTLKNVVTSPA